MGNALKASPAGYRDTTGTYKVLDIGGVLPLPVPTTPTATPTLKPMSTATPTLPLGLIGTLTLSEDFNSLSSTLCQKRTTAQYASWCENGELHIDITIRRGYVGTGPGTSFKDFIAQVEARSVGELGTYGLAFRHWGSPPSYYLFEIRPSGRFRVIKWL